MELVLARIDDRLIHGQVTVGWGRQLNPDHIVLANDAIAADTWQRRVYASSVPPEIQVSILPLAAATCLLNDSSTHGRLLLITATATDMNRLILAGASITEVNLGGLHAGVGTLEMLPFVFLSREECGALLHLVAAGMRLFAQQVPGGREFPVSEQRLREMEERF